jgi:KIF-1 binding protein C terminal
LPRRINGHRRHVCLDTCVTVADNCWIPKCILLLYILYKFVCVCVCITGFVTDHVALLQDQSRLYHFLSQFETDAKRKLAMETRRVELLLPLLSQLNKSAFEVLHKQVQSDI